MTAFASGNLHAQNPATTQPKDTVMNRTVVVEQEYIPEIKDAQKVNVLPQVAEPAVSKKEVQYDTTASPATAIPVGTMPSYTALEAQPSITPGYVRAGYGNYGNLDLLANYLFNLSKRDKLNARFGMNGMDGKLGEQLPSTGKKWNARYYRTQADVAYTHQFDKLDLHIGGDFGLSNFNFLPDGVNRKQKFTSGGLHAGVHSTDEAAPLRFSAEANLLLYGRQHGLVPNEELPPAGNLDETLLHTKLSVGGIISDKQTITIGAEMNNFWYGGYAKNSYTALGLNPYYELTNDDWRLHVGAHVDLSLGFDKLLHVAPDVTAQYLFSDSYVLYAQATGGKQINDFRRLETLCPYGEFSTRPYDTYEQLNAQLGFKASPFPGIWFNVFGGYQNLKNDLASIILETENLHSLRFVQGHTDNFYLGGKVSYEYKDLFSLSAAYTYRSWNAKSNDLLLAMKPVSEASLNLGIHPISALRLNVGFDYLGRKGVLNYKVVAVSDLHADVSYYLFKGVSVYARLHNLLNKKYSYYLDYPTEGLNFLGGLSFRF
jgi:hypothetical protein